MKTSLLGILLSTVATVTSIISTAIPYWWYYEESGFIFHGGLWKSCFSVWGCIDVSISAAPDWRRAVEALTIIGILCLALSVLSTVYYGINESEKKFGMAGAIAALVGGVLFTLAVIVFGAKADLPSKYFHAGFYFGIVTAILAYLASFVIYRFTTAAGYNSI